MKIFNDITKEWVIAIALVLFSPMALSQETEDGWVPASVLCKSAGAFESVLLAESEEAANAIATGQIKARHCYTLPRMVLVKIVEPPVDSFVVDTKDVIYVWRAESAPEVEIYVFSVEEPSI